MFSAKSSNAGVSQHRPEHCETSSEPEIRSVVQTHWSRKTTSNVSSVPSLHTRVIDGAAETRKPCSGRTNVTGAVRFSKAREIDVPGRSRIVRPSCNSRTCGGPQICSDRSIHSTRAPETCFAENLNVSEAIQGVHKSCCGEQSQGGVVANDASEQTVCLVRVPTLSGPVGTDMKGLNVFLENYGFHIVVVLHGSDAKFARFVVPASAPYDGHHGNHM